MLSSQSSAGGSATTASPVGNAAAAATAMVANDAPGGFEATLAQHLPSDDAAAKLLETARKAAKRQMLPEPDAEQAAIFAAMLQAGVLTQDVPAAISTGSADAALATAALAATSALAAHAEAAATTTTVEVAATATAASIMAVAAPAVATKTAPANPVATTVAGAKTPAIPVFATTVDAAVGSPITIAAEPIQAEASAGDAADTVVAPLRIAAALESVAVAVDSNLALAQQRNELPTKAANQASMSLPAGMTAVFVVSETKVPGQVSAETSVVAAAASGSSEASQIANPVSTLPAAPAGNSLLAVVEPDTAADAVVTLPLAAQTGRSAGHAEVSAQVQRTPEIVGDGQAAVVVAVLGANAKDSNPGNADLPQQGRSDSRPSKEDVAPAGLPAGLVLHQQAAGNQATLAPVEATLPALKAEAVVISNPDVLAAGNGVPGRLQMQLQTETMGPLTLDMKMDGNGQAHLVVHAASETLRQSLDGRRDQLVDTMQGLGLALQVDVGRGGQPSSSEGRNQPEAQAARPDQTAPTALATAAITLPRSKPPVGTSQLNFYA